jgi:hypothetical protein
VSSALCCHPSLARRLPFLCRLQPAVSWSDFDEAKRLVRLFADDLSPITRRTADRFKLAVPILRTFAPVLRDVRPGRPQSMLMAELRRVAKELRPDAGW